MDAPSSRLTPAAFWNCRPGEPGKILLVGGDLDTRRLRRRLPPNWPVTAVDVPEAALHNLTDTSVLCVCSPVGDPDAGIWHELLRSCSVLGVPILGVMRLGEWQRSSLAQKWTFLQPQDLLLSETDSPYTLSRWVLEKSTARFFPALASLALEPPLRVPMLRAAFRLLIDRAQEGRPVASLSEIASNLHCHRVTLWRVGQSSGVAIPEAIQRVGIGFAACRYVGSWAEVSALLDITPSGVAHRFRRALLCTATESLDKTFGELVVWAGEAMAGRDNTPGRVEGEE